MLIRLSKGASSEGTGGAKTLSVETVTVACPAHLVLADLPVAKGLGSATAVPIVKMVGRRSRRPLGERVHFCVRCDFPIAIYGRLSPCEHVFCLDCARSDSICYLCDERIQKIQTIKLMEGIFICAAPHCLKSFMTQAHFESHIQTNHADLLQPNAEKEGNESTASDSTLRAPQQPTPRPSFSPNSNPQPHDRDDKSRRPQPPREQPPPPPQLRPIMQPRPPIFPGQFQNYPPESPGFDRPGPTNRFHQPGLDPPRESSLDPPQHPPNFPANQIPILHPPLPFGYPPFPPERAQQFYNTPFEIPRQDLTTENGSEQGSLMGFPLGPRPPWNVGPTGGPPPFEPMQGGGNTVDMTPQPLALPPPPPPLPPPQAAAQLAPPGNRGNFYQGDMGRDGQGYGWQHENRDGFGNGQ